MALRRLDTLTKPLRALGDLQALAARVCVIQATLKVLLWIVDAALAWGRRVVKLIVVAPANTLILGEMGVGHTAAALLMHGLTGIPLNICVGRGTGLDDRGVARKTATLYSALARRFADEAGTLHQRLAMVCDRVVFMVAGLPLFVKGSPSGAA